MYEGVYTCIQRYLYEESLAALVCMYECVYVYMCMCAYIQSCLYAKVFVLIHIPTHIYTYTVRFRDIETGRLKPHSGRLKPDFVTVGLETRS